MADAFRLRDHVAGLAPDRHDFAEFFRAPTGSLSLTVARWPAGSTDDQQPHTEDEVYYVAAGVEHRFGEITQDLEVLVFWSPARHTSAPD